MTIDVQDPHRVFPQMEESSHIHNHQAMGSVDALDALLAAGTR